MTDLISDKEDSMELSSRGSNKPMQPMIVARDSDLTVKVFVEEMRIDMESEQERSFDTIV